MTNKEALSLIESYLKSGYAHNADDFKQALELAIKALEQEPICPSAGIDCEDCPAYEPCGDVISRQAVIEKQYRIDDSATLSTRDVVNVEDIEDLPSVNLQEPKTIQEKQAESEKYQKAFDDGYENGYAQARFDYEQEPKTGHWIDLKEDNEISDDNMWRYSCNMCHGQNFRKTLFCPNCGCAMFEPQERSDKE